MSQQTFDYVKVVPTSFLPSDFPMKLNPQKLTKLLFQLTWVLLMQYYFDRKLDYSQREYLFISFLSFLSSSHAFIPVFTS